MDTDSPLTTLAYNPKLNDQIGAGSYNGLVQIWDVKRGKKPVLVSPVEMSHLDPVTKLYWLGSKTGNELMTSSTDGKVLWWDTRKFNEGPVDTVNLTEIVNSGDDKFERNVGATALEYNTDAGPNKFLIGNEQGLLYMANKKPKKNVEITSKFGFDNGRHLGPIYSIHRNPQNPRYFMTVGDWTTKIWFEDLKTPIMRTRYHQTYLSDGCWSPSRMGVFFLGRTDGWLDIWDYYYRQNELALSYRVSNAAITSLKPNGGSIHNSTPGKYLAIGDQKGTITLIELCESLYKFQPNEKEILNEMFDREARKEKLLETLKKQQELKKQVVKDTNQSSKWEEKKVKLAQIAEEEFFTDAKLDELDYEESIGDYGKNIKITSKTIQENKKVNENNTELLSHQVDNQNEENQPQNEQNLKEESLRENSQILKEQQEHVQNEKEISQHFDSKREQSFKQESKHDVEQKQNTQQSKKEIISQDKIGSKHTFTNSRQDLGLNKLPTENSEKILNQSKPKIDSKPQLHLNQQEKNEKEHSLEFKLHTEKSQDNLDRERKNQISQYQRIHKFYNEIKLDLVQNYVFVN